MSSRRGVASGFSWASRQPGARLSPRGVAETGAWPRLGACPGAGAWCWGFGAETRWSRLRPPGSRGSEGRGASGPAVVFVWRTW